MIRSFRSRALKRLWNDDDPSGVRPGQLPRVRRVLVALDAADKPQDLNLPGYRCHVLHGRPPRYSVTLIKNGRITFEWDGEDAVRVDCEDCP